MIKITHVSEKITGNHFGDPRLNKRLGLILDRIIEKPTVGFPGAMGSEAALEGLYRFLNNPKVTPSTILASHIESSSERAGKEQCIIVIHDTTILKFNNRNGLGIISRSNVRGFYGHFSLAVGMSSSIPLGVLGIEEYIRKGDKGRSRNPKISRRDETSEYHRWARGVQKAEEVLPEGCTTIHVMDREGDSFEHFSQFTESNYRFVIRATHDRKLEDGKLFETLEELPGVYQREVPVSKRTGGRTRFKAELKIHPSRESRLADLKFSATTVNVQRPGSSLSHNKLIKLNVVRVAEVSPPEGQKPIHWILWTTESIDTVDDILRIVDIYKKRWIIEEFFKAIKTGCAFESRQLEEYKTLGNALAIFSIVAWQLLALRSMSRIVPEAKASKVLNPLQLKILVKISEKKLTKEPSAQDALYAIAALGGHIPNNGLPGWMVIGRGFEKILTLERHFYELKEVE